MLQVSGTSEYLELNSQLKDYEYVHLCYKYDRDLEFNLTEMKDVQRPYLRTSEDDLRDSHVAIEDISPKDQIQTLPYDNLKIILGKIS